MGGTKILKVNLGVEEKLPLQRISYSTCCSSRRGKENIVRTIVACIDDEQLDIHMHTEILFQDERQGARSKNQNTS